MESRRAVAFWWLLPALLLWPSAARSQSVLDVQRHLESGMAKEKKGDLDGAALEYTQVLLLDPRHGKAYALRAGIRLRQLDYEGAVTDSSKAVEIDSKDGRAYGVRCLAKARTGKDDAEVDGKKAVTLAPNDAFCHFAYAHSMYGRFERSIKELSKAIELDPAMSEAWLARGRFKRWTGDPEGAFADADRGVELAPADPNSYLQRGYLREEAGDWDKAVADFTKSLDLDPKSVHALLARGRVKTILQDFSEAIEDASKALTIHPKSAYAFQVRGQARLRNGDLKAALADFDQAVLLGPNLELYKSRGWARYTAGAWDAAMTDFRKCLELKQSSSMQAPLWIFLARARLGEVVSAKAELDKTLAGWTSPQYDGVRPFAQFLLGKSNEEQLLAAVGSEGNYSKYRRCEACFYIGTSRLLEKKTEAAIKAFQDCLDTKVWWTDEFGAAAADLERLKPGK